MRKPIKIVEVKSELGAGTRGASLGIEAMKIAAMEYNTTFFVEKERTLVQNENELLYRQSPYTCAKYIDGIIKVQERISYAVSETLQAGYFPLILAGDHSNAAGSLAGIKKAYPDKRIGVVWIDAHSDLHTPYTTPSGNMHGMPLGIATGIDNTLRKVNDPDTQTIALWEKLKNINGVSPKVLLEDIVYIAVRDMEPAEIALLKEHKIKNFSVQELHEKGSQGVVEETLERLAPCDLLYVSFDVDSMDPSLSVGTGTPVPGGLSLKEACTLNRSLLANAKVYAWEMVEINPLLDSRNKMAKLGWEVIKAGFGV